MAEAVWRQRSEASSIATSSPRELLATARRPARYQVSTVNQVLPAAFRRRGAAPGDPAAHHRRRMLFQHWHERDPTRFRPRFGSHPCRAGARWLSRQRDQVWTSGAHHNHYCITLVPDLGPAWRPTQGAEPAPGRPEDAGHHHPPDHQPRRPARLERGHLQRRVHSRELPDRQRRRRLAAGHQRARFRAQRPRALHANFYILRELARARPAARQARQRRSPDA